MRCLACGSEAVTGSKQFNERSGGCPRSAARLCRAYDDLPNYLRPRSHHHQHVPADSRRLLYLQRSVTVLAIMEAA